MKFQWITFCFFALLISGTAESFPFKSIPFSISIEAEFDSSLALNIEGTITHQEDTWGLELQSFEGQYGEELIQLLEPMRLTYTSNAIHITPFVFFMGPTTLSGDLKSIDNKLEGSFHLHNLPLEKTKLTIPLRGLISADGQIGGTFQAPEAQLSVDVHHASINEMAFKDLPPSEGKIDISLNKDEAILSANLTTELHPPIEIAGKIPITFRLDSPEFSIDTKREIDATISASGEITPLLQLIPSSAISLSAQAAVSMHIAGTIDAPKFFGSCEIQNGIFENPTTGIVIHNIHAYGEANGTDIRITHLTADSTPQGKIEGNGYVGLDPIKGFQFEVIFDIQHATLLHTDFLQAVGGGRLTFYGDINSGTLSGKLQTEEALLTIPEHTKALMDSVEVTYVNVPEGMQPPIIVQNDDSWIFNYDIFVDIPRNLTIKGRDLTSLWKGEVKVTGNGGGPLVFGEVRASNGQYMFNGKPFSIDQGTILLSGDPEKKTQLYVIASKDLDKVKVDVILKGPVKNPEITFRSNPPMPQREILSWILFNRGTSEISPFQGSQLNESITNLDTTHQGPDVLTKLRTAVGIDRIEICRNENGDGSETSVQVGKYISDNIFVSVTKSDVNRLAIEAALTNHIKVQAQVGDDSQGQVLFKWKKDY